MPPSMWRRYVQMCVRMYVCDCMVMYVPVHGCSLHAGTLPQLFLESELIFLNYMDQERLR